MKIARAAAIVMLAAGMLTGAVSASAATTARHPRITFGTAAVNPVAAKHTVTTKIEVVPDSGYDGNNWGLDTYNMAFTWDRVKQVTTSQCGAGAARCYEYTWSAKFTGSTQTVQGQESPGEPFTPLDVVEQANLSGSMSGEYLSSYKRVYTQYVPSAYDANGISPTGDYQPQLWFGLAQPGAHEVNTTASTYAWSFSYTVPKGNDAQCPAGTWHWVDADNVAEAASGNILAPSSADCSTQAG